MLKRTEEKLTFTEDLLYVFVQNESNWIVSLDLNNPKRSVLFPFYSQKTLVFQVHAKATVQTELLFQSIHLL